MLYDKERLDAAYAKVGLFADSAWAVNDADGYYKANQNLWKQACALKEPCEKLGKPRSVLDTIPESRLAGYGTYLYDEEREKQYWGEYERPNYPVEYDKTPISPNNEEIWCSENVEKIFNILTNPYSKTSELEKRCQEVINGVLSSAGPSTESCVAVGPKTEQLAIEYNIEETKAGEEETTNNTNNNNNKSTKKEFETLCSCSCGDDSIHNAPPRGTAKNFSELVLQMQLHSEEIRALWERNSQYSLNVNVPEFYPKQPAENNYGTQDEVEPEPDPEPEQPVCEYETVLVPSLVPWLNYSYPLRSLDFREINYLANEFENLIMNDSSPCTSQTKFQQSGQAEEATASITSSGPVVADSVPTPQQQQQQQQPASSSVQQQQKQQPSVSEVSTSSATQGSSQQQTKQQPAPQATVSTLATIQQEQQPTRRLYSAVLQNQTSDSNVAKTASVDEFEELEREALEQYRPSTENLRRASTDSIISAKYQELERLALEQYNSASSTDTSVGGQGNECNPLHEPPCGGKMSPYAALLLANSVLVGFYRSVVNTRLLTNLYSNVSRYR